MSRVASVTARSGRWRAPAQMLATLRRNPDVTRAELARRLRMSSGSAAEVTARMRAANLVTEVPAPVEGRGRPTTRLRAHPRGPVVLTLEIRYEDWRLAAVSLDGRLRRLDGGRHGDPDPERVLARLAEAVDRARRRLGSRARVVSLAVAGTVAGNRLVQASSLGWGPTDLTRLVSGSTDPQGDIPLLVGRDATLAGVAEARDGAGAGARVVLHVLVEVGAGGTLVVDGLPLAGATGAAGEFGHMPFGDRRRRCTCGAYGCWQLDVDGLALARLLGEPAPVDPRTYMEQVLRRAAEDGRARAAVQSAATSLGAGVAGLTNATDPEVVTLSGLAVGLRAAAPDSFAQAYSDGLMDFHRADPPAVLDAAFGDDGPLHGAAALGLDLVTSEEALADWADGVEGTRARKG